MKFLPPALAFCLLASCSSPPENFVPRLASLDGGTSTTTDLTGAKIPILRSTYFEQAWGAPVIQKMTDGGWKLRYRKGNTLNFVTICSMSSGERAPVVPPQWDEATGDPMSPGTPSHSQKWRSSIILGQQVRWYQVDGGTGADFPRYKTVDFQATGPDGRSGWYRVEVEATRDAEVMDWINRVNW
ncbi:MAG: hypothetical protein QM755_03250 [Luteolibacter sp.]